jgi:serine/threonine protein kinase
VPGVGLAAASLRCYWPAAFATPPATAATFSFRFQMDHPISPTPPIIDAPANGTSLAVAAAGPLVAEIYVYAGQEFLAKYAIEHGEYLIGRDESCHIPIDADRISRHHARLTFGAYELVIEDLGSSNGLFIDGVQVQLPTRLRPDQEVQIGSARLFVRLDDATSRQLAASMWDADLGLAPARRQLEQPKYRVITTIARGGMGVILQARDLRIRRTVAMKVMKAGAQFSKENVLRFIDEAQLTGQLEHPNIVPVYELGIDEHGESFYTMKFVKGITLDEVLRGLRHGRRDMLEKFPLGTLLTVFQKICDAVAFAHSKGVVHRDLKPENVMIGAYGEVLVMDWGLAKQMADIRRGGEKVETALDSKPRDPLRGFETMHGVVVGTPPYVSPEQARGELDAIDPRSDVYVLGGILYAVLTLRAPIAGDTVPEILEKILQGDIEPPLNFNQPPKSQRRALGDLANDDGISLAHCPNGRIPEGLAAVAMKALHVEPAARYQTVEEMQADIAAYQGGFAPKAERATLGRQLLLFAGRHKREVALLVIGAVIVNVMLATFFWQITAEKNRAQTSEQRALASEQRARESEKDLAKALEELRGTAPIFAQEAASLLDSQQFEEALDRIDYAIEQVPNEAQFHFIRGNVLQSMLRLGDAIGAYEEALRRNPKHTGARQNLDLTKKLVAQISPDGEIKPATLRELHGALVGQKRIGEALGVLNQIGKDRQLFYNTWRAFFAKRGLSARAEPREDETLYLDLSKAPLPDLRKLRDAPVVGLNLDDTRLADISALKGMPLASLSLNRAPVRDLSPLAGMPLRSLQLDGTPAANLSPLSQLPLETLRLSGSRIDSLGALQGLKLEHLDLSGCRRVRDLAPLAGMPLEHLDLSRTGVADLSPLSGSPLRVLILEGCVELTDLRPLLEIKTLESVLLPAQCKDIAFLREHPSLRRLSYKKLTQSVDDFWAQWDAKQRAEKP